MGCSASDMFALANVKFFKGVSRKTIYKLMTKIDKSQNPNLQNVAISDVYCTPVYNYASFELTT